MSEVLDRYKTRLNESEAMKLETEPTGWRRDLADDLKALMRNERNNGREDMANAIREVWSAKLYRNDLTADDLILSAKIYLRNKGK